MKVGKVNDVPGAGCPRASLDHEHCFGSPQRLDETLSEKTVGKGLQRRPIKSADVVFDSLPSDRTPRNDLYNPVSLYKPGVFNTAFSIAFLGPGAAPRAGKLLELPGNTVQGAQENIGRTYDVELWQRVFQLLGEALLSDLLRKSFGLIWIYAC